MNMKRPAMSLRFDTLFLVLAFAFIGLVVSGGF
jgi:hypothetical protein